MLRKMIEPGIFLDFILTARNLMILLSVQNIIGFMCMFFEFPEADEGFS